jgi:hypothetical protein
MSKQAFGSSTFRKTPAAPHVESAGSYSPAHVLSPAQFSNSGNQVRERVSIGNLRISVTGHGAKFSVGGAGFRFSSSGRITHRTTIKD